MARKALELVREIRALKHDLDLAAKSALDDAEETARLPALLKAVYPLIDDRPGAEELQAELERGGAAVGLQEVWSVGVR